MSAAQMGACAMANQSRKKGGKRAFGKTLIRLFFVLMLLSMLAAYISNLVTISSKRAELETLNEQIAQQQTENQEMQRILSGDADQITEWVARDSYNYAAPNERIFVDVTGKGAGRQAHSRKTRSIAVWQLRLETFLRAALPA